MMTSGMEAESGSIIAPRPGVSAEGACRSSNRRSNRCGKHHFLACETFRDDAFITLRPGARRSGPNGGESIVYTLSSDVLYSNNRV